MIPWSFSSSLFAFWLNNFQPFFQQLEVQGELWTFGFCLFPLSFQSVNLSLCGSDLLQYCLKSVSQFLVDAGQHCGLGVELVNQLLFTKLYVPTWICPCVPLLCHSRFAICESRIPYRQCNVFHRQWMSRVWWFRCPIRLGVPQFRQ